MLACGHCRWRSVATEAHCRQDRKRVDEKRSGTDVAFSGSTSTGDQGYSCSSSSSSSRRVRLCAPRAGLGAVRRRAVELPAASGMQCAYESTAAGRSCGWRAGKSASSEAGSSRLGCFGL